MNANKMTLGNVTPGKVIKIGDREYIVLGHDNGATSVITKDFVNIMPFGKDGNYATSDIRKYCNVVFYRELCKAVGVKNIVKHTVNLIADDGSDKNNEVLDNVSILTTDLYRKYRELIPAYGDWWWTATRITTLEDEYYTVCCKVNAFGALQWGSSFYPSGVRPFCVLKSSITDFSVVEPLLPLFK